MRARNGERGGTRLRQGAGASLLAALVALSACADARAPAAEPGTAPRAVRPDPWVDPYSPGVLIGPGRKFDPARPPPFWFRLGAAQGATRFSVAEKEGVLALRLETAGFGSALGPRFTAPLLAMPYLRWGWFLEPAAPARPAAGGPPEVPLRLVVAFRGGAAPGTGGEAAAIPGADRILSLEWRAAGPAPAPAPAEGATARMVIRAGQGDAGRWLNETVDLARIYTHFWPQDAIAQASVVYAGAGAGPTGARAVGYVAEVVLSR